MVCAQRQGKDEVVEGGIAAKAETDDEACLPASNSLPSIEGMTGCKIKVILEPPARPEPGSIN